MKKPLGQKVPIFVCTVGAICSQTLPREALPTFLRFQKSLFWTIFRSFLSKEMLQNRPRKLVWYKIAVLEPLQKLFIQRNASKGPCIFFHQHGPLFRFLSKKIISRSVGRTLFGPKRWSHFGQKSEKKMHKIDTAVGTRGFMRDFLGARVRSSHLDEWNFSRPPKFQSPLIEKNKKIQTSTQLIDLWQKFMG